MLINNKFLHSSFVICSLVIVLCGCVPQNEADRHFKNATDFMELQMFREAIIELKNGVQVSEKDEAFAKTPDGYLLKATILMFENKNDDAIKLLESSSKTDKRNWSVYLLLASLYMQKKNYMKASETIEKIPVTELNYGQADFVKGLDLFEKGEFPEAIDALTRARNQFNQKSLSFKESSGSQQLIKNGATLMVAYLLGRAYEGDDRYKDALVSYKDVEQLSPIFPGLLEENINIVLRKMDLKNNPNNSSLYNSIGWGYFNLQQYSQAAKNFEKAIAINPKFSLAYNNLGLVYFKNKNYPEAIACFKKVISFDNDERAKLFAYGNLGRIFRGEENYDEAVEMLNKALEIDPTYEIARKEFKIAMLHKMIKQRPKDKSLYEDLGDSYLNGGEIDNAIDAYLSAVANARVYYKLSRAYINAGKYNRSIEMAKKTLKIEPKYWQASFVLGLALKAKGQLPEAINALKNSLSDAGKTESAAIKNELAYAYFENNDIGLAIRQFKELAQVKEYQSNVKKILGVIE